MMSDERWTPSANPDPQAILDEAKQDTADGRYAVALDKHVWFHRHALDISKSLYGVRLSFALGYWRALAVLYPPAMEALKSVRDETEKTVRDIRTTGDALRNAFHDFQAINEKLNEPGRTRDLFAWLAEHDPANARRYYQIAQSALVRAKDYALCGKYMDPKALFTWSVERYRGRKQLANDPKHGINLREFGEKCFRNEIAILVALLVRNNKDAEAEQFALDAVNEFEDDEFVELLEAAMEGVVPEPWP